MCDFISAATSWIQTRDVVSARNTKDIRVLGFRAFFTRFSPEKKKQHDKADVLRVY